MPIEAHPFETNVGVAAQEALPGLAAAFDEEAMKGYVAGALFGAHHPAYTIERCTPTRPLYIPGDCCVLRYRLRARNSTSGEILEALVTGRVFANRSSCAAYMREKLAPLAVRMRERPEVAAFAAPAAMIDALNMVVHVWPVDGELPTLIDATDRRRMIDVFGQDLPDALAHEFVVKDCRIDLVSYRRRQRCVLRYTVEGEAAGSSDVRTVIVYGKVTGVGNETLASPAIQRLRDHVAKQGGPRFTLPRLLAWRPELQLALLEAFPGQARVKPALRARLRGEPPPRALPLEEMVVTCGHVAATLHTSGLDLGPVHTLEDELARLKREIASAREFVPDFGERASSSLEEIATHAGRSEPLDLCLSHGDFNHGQLLFDAARGALLDLDTLCQAEPALDLGKFIAHLRAEAHKEHLRAEAKRAHVRAEAENVQRQGSRPSALGEELAERFLRAYFSAVGGQLEDEARVRARATIYEMIALIRVALRSQHDFDAARLGTATALLEERMAAICRR